MNTPHTVHIPVMGTAFSIDTPIKVAPYGISSVISLVDDALIEDMRAFYSKAEGAPYTPITKYDEDFRAKRITAYLNLVDKIVKRKFKAVQESAFEEGSEITKYFEMLPETSSLKSEYLTMLTAEPALKKQLQERLRLQMKPGDINVNIMTKLDRVNYDSKKNELPSEYSDALAALRGYAKSCLESAIVFSAGINRRLYSYVEKFNDFYADTSGDIKKRIILKVSDYRSSLIQGRFFAKKGLWVSEYRVESGLNCGGHAFASDGFLMGPILEEFKKKKQELVSSLHQIYTEALTNLTKPVPKAAPAVAITAQGGIGTSREDKFLIKFYGVDGTGWGTPFLLVPEVTNVDDETLARLVEAKEQDVHLSESSPLGVPFHNLKKSPSELERERKAQENKPGSACPKGHLVSNTEFTEKPICTASRQYQKLKIESLLAQQLNPAVYKQKLWDVVKKSCICNDLGESALIKNGIAKQGKKMFSAVCPGPNIAYFSRIVSLREMIDHIYGRTNILDHPNRPHMFIKELRLYVDYFINEVKKAGPKLDDKQIAYLNEFCTNMINGIEYYKELFPKMIEETKEIRDKALSELDEFLRQIEKFIAQYQPVFSPVLERLTVV